MNERLRPALALLVLTFAACSGGGSAPPVSGKLAMTTMIPSTPPNEIAAPPMASTTIESGTQMAARKPQSQIQAPGWVQMTGAGQSGVASPDGSLYVISNVSGGPGGNTIWHYVNGTWSQIPGAASRLAVGPDATLWAITVAGGIYHLVNGSWTTMAGGAGDITIAADGSVYVVSNAYGGPGGNTIWHYANGAWSQLPGAGVRIAATWDTGTYPGGITPGGFFLTTAQGQIYTYSPSSGYALMSGAALQLAPTTSGGLFAVGNDTATNHSIWYDDLSSGSWVQEPGGAIDLATNSNNVYAISANGGIYVSPVNAIAGQLPSLPLALSLSNLPGQFYGEIVGQLAKVSPRGMVMLPNGDLLIGTGGGTANFAQSGQIYIIPNAEAAVPASPTVFATLTDHSCAGSAPTNTNGIAFAPSSGGGTIFVGMECSVWKIPYVTGDHVASSTPSLFANVRTGATVATAIDSDVHHTTSLLAVGNTLYVSVGSSCNACIETDPTRGTVQKTSTTSAALTPVAIRVRNALALAYNPATGTVWAGGAGQDCVVGTTCFAAMDDAYQLDGHPYEWLDPMTAHAAPADYAWPWCEENHAPVTAPDGTPATPPAGTNCNTMIVAPVRAPAYATIMGAAFYAPPSGAAYAFPASFDNGLFFTVHGSWHENDSGIPVALPEVVFVPMSGDAPVYPMDWSSGSPYSTWARNSSGNPAPFLNGFQSNSATRIGRPAAVVVGPQGSLFISDDAADAIYRIRPGTGPAAARRGTPTAALGWRR